MKILITGTNGLVGSHLLEVLKANKGYCLIACSKGEDRLATTKEYIHELLDITNAAAVNEVIERHIPDIIVHAAAQTQADVCETDRSLCWETNVSATSHLLAAAKKYNSRFIFLSTDFVFNGEEGPYREEDQPDPVNYYGCSKVAAEELVMKDNAPWNIIRTVLVYGKSLVEGRDNMFTWVHRSLTKNLPIKVVNDQLRTPTFIDDLVRGIELVIQKNRSGIFHIAGKESLTPFDMASKIAEVFQLNRSLITEVNASVFTQAAKRPPKTGFIIDKARRELGYEPMRFEESLQQLRSNA